MKFPTLYKRTATGAVQQWKIWTIDNQIFTEYGQQDGKLQTSIDVVDKGKNIGKKNETTPEEQAEAEAQATFDKKKKSGGYWESISDIDEQKFVKPMLAKKFEDYKHKIDWDAGVIVQTKYNGLRCVATKEGLFTRKGERYISVPHIYESLKEFFKEHPDAVLDGELFNYELRQKLNEIVELCRKTKNVTKEDLVNSEKMVKYYVYDGYNKNPKLDYTARKVWLEAELHKVDYIEQVDGKKCHSLDEVNKVYEECLADGQEGIIVRIPNSPYENKRSKYLLKQKPTDDAEFIITDVNEGSGPWAGKAKIISLRSDSNQEFNATFKGSMEDAEDMLKEKNKYIGKTARIFFNGYTGLGTPNYAQFDYNNWKVVDK